MATQATRKKARFDSQAIQKAAREGRYIKADGKTGFLTLGGAVKRWADPLHAQDVYVPDYRVAGSPGAVASMLARGGVAPADIDAALARAYTAARQNDPQFLAAVAQDSRPKRRRGAGITLDQLGAFLEKAEPVTAPKRAAAGGRKKGAGAGAGAGRKPAGAKPKARKPKGKASPRTRGGATPRGAPRMALADRLARLAPGKALDVSKIGTDGSGVKTINMPTERSNKLVVPGLGIASDNENAYRTALALLGPNYNNYLPAYQQAAAARLAGAATGRVSPRASQLPGAIPLLPPTVQAQLQQAPRPISPVRATVAPLPLGRPPSPVRATVAPLPVGRPPSPLRQPTAMPLARPPSPLRQPTALPTAIPPATRMPAQLPMLPLAGPGGLPGLAPLAPLGGLPPAGGALGARLSPRGPR